MSTGSCLLEDFCLLLVTHHLTHRLVVDSLQPQQAKQVDFFLSNSLPWFCLPCGGKKLHRLIVVLFFLFATASTGKNLSGLAGKLLGCPTFED